MVYIHEVGKVGRSLGARPMDPVTPIKTKIAVLNDEMDGIHFINSLYWGRGDAVPTEARAEHQRRQDRLEEIGIELAQLRLS